MSVTVPLPCDILFLGLARNCARTLPNFFRFVAELRGAGLRVRAAIGENGSTDDTRALLLKHSRADASVEILATDFMATIPERLPRMAAGREFLRLHASKNHPATHHVCVVDLDSVFAAPPTVAALVSSLDRLAADASLFAVAASSKPLYYDLLALRCEGLFMENLQHTIVRAKRNPLTYRSTLARCVHDAQERVSASSLRHCVSAFNGLCLYRAEPYYAHSYIDARDRESCEHVVLNTAIHASTGSHVLIDDGLIVTAPPEHLREQPLRFYTVRLLRLMRSVSIWCAGSGPLGSRDRP